MDLVAIGEAGASPAHSSCCDWLMLQVHVLALRTSGFGLAEHVQAAVTAVKHPELRVIVVH